MSSAAIRLSRAFDAIGAEPDGVTVTELAARLEMSTAAASRLVASMVEAELVTPAETGRQYLLHPRFWGWGIQATQRVRRLFSVAGPAIVDAVRESGERITFSAIHGRQTIFFEPITPPSTSIVPPLPQGRLVPVHACAPGKAMLAYQPDDVIEKILSHPLERLTTHTITSPEALRDELVRIRERGYATNRGEFTEHGSGVAVVIFDSRGKAIAALSSGGRNTEAEFAQAEAMVPVLRRLADNISALLGHASGG